MAIDSDEIPVAILLQSDAVNASHCDRCRRAAAHWPSDASYHPASRPGAMFRAALYCADCMPCAYNDEGDEVRTFCGMRHQFTDGKGYACGCFS